MAQESFDDKVLECVENGMAQIGESSARAILWHIEKDNHLPPKEIASNPKRFIASLEKILGPGATIVEKMIVRQIVSKFKIPEDVQSLAEAVERARAVS